MRRRGRRAPPVPVQSPPLIMNKGSEDPPSDRLEMSRSRWSLLVLDPEPGPAAPSSESAPPSPNSSQPILFPCFLTRRRTQNPQGRSPLPQQGQQLQGQLAQPGRRGVAHHPLPGPVQGGESGWVLLLEGCWSH